MFFGSTELLGEEPSVVVENGSSVFIACLAYSDDVIGLATWKIPQEQDQYRFVFTEHSSSQSANTTLSWQVQISDSGVYRCTFSTTVDPEPATKALNLQVERKFL